MIERKNWQRGGCRKVRVHPAECGEQLGRNPSKNGSSKSLVLKSFSGEGTLWDSSLPVALTLWDTLPLCTLPLPLSQKKKRAEKRIRPAQQSWGKITENAPIPGWRRFFCSFPHSPGGGGVQSHFLLFFSLSLSILPSARKNGSLSGRPGLNVGVKATFQAKEAQKTLPY